MKVPEGYQSALDVRETEVAIKEVKDFFERALATNLNLTRVSAPLFVAPETGLNDDLNGVERRFLLESASRMTVLYRLYILWQNGNATH